MQLNWLLFQLLQESFADSILLGFRRLMDRQGLQGPCGVYSLWSLLDDVSQHSHLLVRNAIIQIGPLDDRRDSDEFLRDWARTRHWLLDDLIGLTEDQRMPDDRIPKCLFDRRRAALEAKFRKAERLINKEVAHPATPESRHGIDYQGVRWGDLYDFHAELCKTAHLLQDLISESGMNSFLPVFRGDEFQYLSRPIIAEQDIQKLADRWGALQYTYASWKNWRQDLAESSVVAVSRDTVKHPPAEPVAFRGKPPRGMKCLAS